MDLFMESFSGVIRDHPNLSKFLGALAHISVLRGFEYSYKTWRTKSGLYDTTKEARSYALLLSQDAFKDGPLLSYFL
jgi:hypothetical protein